VATYAAISVIANTLRMLLLEAVPAGEFTGVEVKLLRTQDFQDSSARLSLGLSIYLHRLDFNTHRRNLPPRVDPKTGERFHSSTPVDLHFLITAWGQTAEQQMNLIAWAIRTLQDTPQLPAGLLNRFGGESPDPVFADTEAVELVGEILTAQDFVNLWGNTLANQQPAVSYVARQVLIDSAVEMPDAALVQTRKFNYASPLPSA
jgi:hypothetical protein